MSEYQYYEFQALDRRLTEAEMVELQKLSSRVNLTSNRAVFVYNYGDFRGTPEAVLEKYFDAMLYLTNWGTRQLMFRFPKQLLNIEAIEHYCIEGAITLETSAKYATLNISIHNEDSAGWVDEDEGEEGLDRMIPLRNAILQGDYRALYFAWLRVCELQFGTGSNLDLEDKDEAETASDDDTLGEYDAYALLELSSPEPPIPPNLKDLDDALKAFVEFFEINPLWIAVGTANSPVVVKAKEPFEQWIAALPEPECRRLLLRAAQDESNIGLYIRTELRKRFAVAAPLSPTAGKTRTVAQLLAVVQENIKRETEERQKQAEQARLKRLKELAQQEPTLWKEVMVAIQQKNSKGYDQAVSLLSKLRELAESRGEQIGFKVRVEQIYNQFPTLSSLRSRMISAGLIKR